MQIRNTHNTSINCSVVSYNKIYSAFYFFIVFWFSIFFYQNAVPESLFAVW